MGRPKGWGGVTGRPVERSPGRPPRGGGSIGCGSGRRSPRALEPWRRLLRPVCRAVGVRGFGRVAGCHLSLLPRCRGVTCRSLSGRRSLCCAPRGSGCGRSLAGRALAVDDLAGVAPQRRDSQRLADVSGVHRAVARRPAGRRPKPAKLAVNARAATVCAGPPVRRVQRPDGTLSRVRRSGGSAGVMAGARTGVGEVVEPGADLQSAAPGLPG